MKKKLLNALKKEIAQIINKHDACLIQNCNNFIQFSGNDIDALYEKKKSDIKLKNIIILDKKKKDFRLYLNHPKFIEFLRRYFAGLTVAD